MSLNLIINDTDEEHIRQLNLLIQAYNHNINNNHSICFLQQIDALSAKLHQHFQTIPKMGDMSGDAMNFFLKWHLQKPVQLELRANFPECFKVDKYATNVNDKERVFIEASSKPNVIIPNIKTWQKLTTSLLGDRSKQYKELDRFLVELQLAQNAYTKLEDNELGSNSEIKKIALDRVVCALNEIQQSALAMLQEVPEDKPKMMRNFKILLASTNFLLKQTINLEESLKFNYLTSEPQQHALLDTTIHEGQKAITGLVKSLFLTTDNMTLGDYDIRYLGGVNNKNWLAKNNESGDTCIIRLEKADEPVTDFFIVQEIKADPILSQYLAKDRFYYPTNHVVLEEKYERIFNIAVSEFCPHGDLASYTRNKSNFSANDAQRNEEVTSKVLDMSVQVAKMASDLIKSGKAYMDIKAGNFLIRDDGKIITADIKSIVRTDANGQVPSCMVSTTFAAPGMVKRAYDAQAFASYQIGLMMYDLLVGDKEQSWIDQLDNKKPLDFAHPIFATERGKKIEQLIQATLDEDPQQRPSLSELIDTCKEFAPSLEHNDEEVEQYVNAL